MTAAECGWKNLRMRHPSDTALIRLHCELTGERVTCRFCDVRARLSVVNYDYYWWTETGIEREGRGEG